MSSLVSAAPSSASASLAGLRKSSRGANSRRLQTPSEDHHHGHHQEQQQQQRNNLHSDDSKISRIQPLRSYASTAFADLPSHFDPNQNNNNNRQRYHHNSNNHINFQSGSGKLLQEPPNSAKQPRHHHATNNNHPAALMDGKKLTNQEVLRWVTTREFWLHHKFVDSWVTRKLNEPREIWRKE